MVIQLVHILHDTTATAANMPLRWTAPRANATYSSYNVIQYRGIRSKGETEGRRQREGGNKGGHVFHSSSGDGGPILRYSDSEEDWVVEPSVSDKNMMYNEPPEEGDDREESLQKVARQRQEGWESGAVDSVGGVTQQNRRAVRGTVQTVEETRRIVETSMFAAVAGLSYTLATLLKLEGYLSYVLPLPIVLSAMRAGPVYSIQCVAVVSLLLFGACLFICIVVGVRKAPSYVCIHTPLSHWCRTYPDRLLNAAAAFILCVFCSSHGTHSSTHVLSRLWGSLCGPRYEL